MGQYIVTIGRENGSGGRDIAARIAEELHVKMYDYNILSDIAKSIGEDVNPEELLKYEEAPRKKYFSRRVKGHTNSIEEIIAEKQFEYIQEKASTGESFVIVGRCADYILKDFTHIIKMYIIADQDKKIERIAKRHGISEEEAEKRINKIDRARKHYYEKYVSQHKWGEAKGYDITINSSRLGIDKTADYLSAYVREIIGQ